MVKEDPRVVREALSRAGCESSNLDNAELMRACAQTGPTKFCDITMSVWDALWKTKSDVHQKYNMKFYDYCEDEKGK
jgi:hypothetical protein